MDNIEQFSLYTAKIFKDLYESFPVPVSIDRNEMISDCLFFDKEDELQDLNIKKDMASLLIEIGRSDKIDDIKEKLPSIESKHYELESEKNNEIHYQTEIFSNTLEFLVSEGLVRTPDNGGYVLTAKSFSHLNKNFEKGALNEGESSYIKTIKTIFSRTTGVSEKIAIGVAVKVIPSLLGIS